MAQQVHDADLSQTLLIYAILSKKLFFDMSNIYIVGYHFPTQLFLLNKNMKSNSQSNTQILRFKKYAIGNFLILNVYSCPSWTLFDSLVIFHFHLYKNLFSTEDVDGKWKHIKRLISEITKNKSQRLSPANFGDNTSLNYID